MKKTTKRAKRTLRTPQANIKLVKEVVKAQLSTVTGGMVAMARHCKSR